MKRLAALLLLVGVMMLAMAPIASAHVHGFTPLGCLTSDNPNSGAFVGFVMASDAAAPLNGPSGIIPLNASGELPSGGLGADNACK
ncbi:MAG: hypothetical protein K0T01_1067 [Acidimicrobiia bacterium]|jgi:hypothetical protein|nr:hypothetical protein [Acidimicrobiia bacterium]